MRSVTTLKSPPVQNESKRQSLRAKLADFQARNRYACDSNRVDRGTSKVVLASFHLTTAEKRYLQEITIDSLNPDQQFEKHVNWLLIRITQKHGVQVHPEQRVRTFTIPVC